jgi:arylamine N-acetyltransferase
MASSQERPIFSRQQVEQYFDRLKIAEAQRIYHVAELKPKEAYQYLALLQKHQLVEVPFENLTLHYSPYRQVSLHPEILFKKIIGDNNGRGGYCMENNRLFGMLLYTLGFNIHSAGARVFDNGVWSGW